MASSTRNAFLLALRAYFLLILISNHAVLAGLFGKRSQKSSSDYQPIASTSVEPDDSNFFLPRASKGNERSKCDYSYEAVFNLIFSEVKLPHEPKYINHDNRVDSFLRDSSFVKNRIYGQNEKFYLDIMKTVEELRKNKELRAELIAKVCQSEDKMCPSEVRFFLEKFDPQKGNDGVKLTKLYSYDMFNVYAYKLNLFKVYIYLLFKSDVLLKTENKYWRFLMNVLTLTYYGRHVPVKDFDYSRITQIAPNFLYDSYYLSLRFGRGIHYSNKYDCFICPQLFNLLVGKFLHLYGLLSASFKDGELSTIPVKAFFGRYNKFISHVLIVAGLHVFKDAEYALVADILAEGIDPFRQYLVKLTPAYRDFVQFIVQKFVDDVHYAIVKVSNVKKEDIKLSDETKVYLSELCADGNPKFSITKCYYNKKKRKHIAEHLGGVEYLNVRAIAILDREGKNISKYASLARIAEIWNKINKAAEPLKVWKSDKFKKGLAKLKFWNKKAAENKDSENKAAENEADEIGASETGAIETGANENEASESEDGDIGEKDTTETGGDDVVNGADEPLGMEIMNEDDSNTSVPYSCAK